MDKTKLMTVVEARESVRKDFHALLASPTSAWSKWRERIDAKMGRLQANAMLVMKEACCAAMCEGCAERLPVNSQAEHYYTDDDGSPCDGQPCHAYRAGCLTPDSIRAEQEKPDADQG